MTIRRMWALVCCLALIGVVAACDDDPKDPKDPETTDVTDTPDPDVPPTDTTDVPPTDTTDVPPTDTTDVPPTDTTDVPPTDTTDVPPTDTTDPDTITCCTAAQCAAIGQLCNSETCLCEPAPVGTCVNPNDSCDTTKAQPLGFVCLADVEGETEGTCFLTCTLGQNLEDTCPAGSLCAAEESSGFCIPGDCDGFFTTSCDAGEKCVPFWNGANFCTPNGAGVEGAACTSHETCGADLLCVGSVCEKPDCTPISAGKPCPTGEACGGLSIGSHSLDVGFCYETCDPYVVNSRCAEGQWCFPDLETRNIGQCVDSNPNGLGVGEACQNLFDDCDDNMLCISGLCSLLCDPVATGTEVGQCGTNEACSALSIDEDTLAIGICYSVCTPYVSNSGCAQNEWCVPDFETAGIGQCVTSATNGKPAGAVCTEFFGECADGMICLWDECQQLCDPTATGTAPGTCSGDAFCSGLAYQDGTELAVGLCNEPECVYNYARGQGGTPIVACENPADRCLPGDLFGVPLDVCFPPTDSAGDPFFAVGYPLDEFAPCGMTEEYTWCRAAGRCLAMSSTDPTPYCLELCLDRIPPGVGQTNHPMCGRSEAQCAAMFVSTDLGICYNE